jgi:hypothetical protein
VYLRLKALTVCFVASGFLLLATIQGCGSKGPSLGKVSGKVTHKGQPVTKGTITFLPEDKNERAASGTIGSDGNYTLTTYTQGDGAVLGRHRISIVSREVDVPGGKAQAAQTMSPQEIMKGSQSPGMRDSPPAQTALIPARYNSPDTSGLSFVVKEGRNTYDIELTD